MNPNRPDTDCMILLGLTVFAACMVWAAVNDMLTMKIPNACVLLLLGAFVVTVPFSQLGLADIADHVVVMLGTLVFCFCLFMFGSLGAGDGKLIAVTALWLGPSATFTFVLALAVLGGVLCVGVLFVRSQFLPLRLMTTPVVMRLNAADRAVPYALAIGPAGLWVLPQSPWAAYLPSFLGG